MSLSRVVSVHCDNCGVWENTSVDSMAGRRKRGWHTDQTDDGIRKDFCPNCGCTICHSLPRGQDGGRFPGYPRDRAVPVGDRGQQT